MATPITDVEREFINYVATYRRSYATKEEYNQRLEIFAQNYNDIQTHNANNAVAHGYTKGINQFTDLSVAEFKQRLGGRFDDSANKTYLQISNEPVANDFDWRNAGAVGYPKDQG